MTESLRLFLVEDDDDIALLIRKSLERAGHRVTTCRTAADALTVLGDTHFNLVILDQILPDMSGLDLLQTMNHDGIHVPVLMVTGYGDEQLATQVLQAGAVDYVAKDQALAFLAELPKRVNESIARHRLQDTNRLLIQALESTSDGVLITDLEGKILHVNQALEDMSGYDRREMLGQTPRLFRSGVQPPEDYANLWTTVLARRSWQGELINRRKDGTLFDVSLTVSPVLASGEQMTHLVGIYHDIHERKQLQRQLLQAQKLQSVGTLAGGIAHEFNNLLAGIQGYAALAIREQPLGQSTHEFLNNIIELSDRAASLTRQLLAFARKPALSREPTRLADLVQATAELVRRTLALTVQVQLPPAEQPPLGALADINQLQQVLINLVLNARDALQARLAQDSSSAGLERRAIVFSLRHEVLDREKLAFPEKVLPGDYAVIEVQDNGIGMSQDVLSQAFDPFFTTKGVGQGTGLGLPVAFGIVQGHQGYLTIDTQPMQGTCASIYLPRLPDPGAGSSQSGIEQGEAPKPEKVMSRRILVVDDEEAVLDVFRRFLEIAGHEVTTATSGKDAVKLLQQGLAADLVLLDLMIPHEEGGRNLHNICQARPGIPVLLCTGLVQSESSFASLIEKAAGILHKPFRMRELWHAVNEGIATKI
jgi:PAS domain S-box-containing protein